MIILAAGTLEKLFSEETSAPKDATQSDSRFRSWLKPADQTVTQANASASVPYKNRATRFE